MEKQPIRVCAVADVPSGSGKAFQIGSKEIAVFHVDGKFYATSNICSHEEESLADGWLEGACIECPRHGAQFSLKTGEALSLPATEPIAVYQIEIRDNDLYIYLPE